MPEKKGFEEALLFCEGGRRRRGRADLSKSNRDFETWNFEKRDRERGGGIIYHRNEIPAANTIYACMHDAESSLLTPLQY
jgi:hypothetical protein